MNEARKTWSLVGFAVGCAGLALHTSALQPWTLDDAFITFRYAENLGSGAGPVYNVGERVEGYTTFLWMALLGLGHALGADTRILAKTLGAGFAVSTLFVVSQSWRASSAISPRAAGIAAAVLGTCGVFTAWAMPGMEVPLVALLLTVTTLASLGSIEADRGWGWAGLAGALAMMTRPDSIVWVAVCMGALGLRAGVTRSASPLVAWAALVSLYGPYFAWRYTYYGWLLPNTFYAKVGATEAQVWRGVEYITDSGWPLAGLLLGALGSLAVLRRNAALGLLWAGLGLQIAYVVSVGGDVMPAFRFFSGVVPALALLSGVGFALVWSRSAVAGGVLVMGALVANLWLFDNHADLRPRIERGVVGRNGEEVGRFLADNFPPDTLLATNTAGSVPYFSGLRTIDMLGLNDSHIAHRTMPNMGSGRAGHEKADGAYVFGRDPDVVQLGSARGRAKPSFRSDRELVRQPGFADRYVQQRYRLPSGARLVLFVRRDWVESGKTP